MSVGGGGGGGRYCGIGDATVLQSRAGRLPNSPSFTFLVISAWAQSIPFTGAR